MTIKTGVVLILLIVSVSGLPLRSSFPASRGQENLFSQPPDSGVHRTYKLDGDSCPSPYFYCWNTTSPGPSLNASDGDTLTILLRSLDGANHNWYLEFNKDLTVDSNEIATRSADFNCNTYCLNFTFTPFLGQGNMTMSGKTYVGIPHGGTFTYRCQYHPFMYGNFTFNAGPVASFTHTPSTPPAGNPVSFDASSSSQSTNATNITNYAWDFGDATTNSTPKKTTTHIYTAPGNYSVTLNVTDNLSQNASTTDMVRVLNPPPDPFDYQITITPDNVSLQAGRSLTAGLTLNLVSGTPENVTLTILISPSDPLKSTQVVLNRTSGFPPFPASLSITTTSSSLCYPDPCFLRRTIIVTVVAVTDTGVDHNATFTLSLTPTPAQPAPDYLSVATYAGIAAVAVITGTVVLRWFRKKKVVR